MNDYLKWSNSDSANFILKWAEKLHEETLVELVKANAEEVGRKSKEDFWNTYNDNDKLGFSQNPYSNERDRERNLKRIETSTANLFADKKILDFIRTKICNLISEEK